MPVFTKKTLRETDAEIIVQVVTGVPVHVRAVSISIANVDEIAVRGASCCHVPSEAARVQMLLGSLYEYAAAARPATGTSASELGKQ